MQPYAQHTSSVHRYALWRGCWAVSARPATPRRRQPRPLHQPALWKRTLTFFLMHIRSVHTLRALLLPLSPGRCWHHPAALAPSWKRLPEIVTLFLTVQLVSSRSVALDRDLFRCGLDACTAGLRPGQQVGASIRVEVTRSLQVCTLPGKHFVLR